MELFGSLPPEAGGMDLFHLMSVWRPGGETRITGWRSFNWHEGAGGGETLCNISPIRQRAKRVLFWGLQLFYYFGWLKVKPPTVLHELCFPQAQIAPFRWSSAICCR